jgi:hypothetical protein
LFDEQTKDKFLGAYTMKVYIVIYENKHGIRNIDKVFMNEAAAMDYRQEQAEEFPNYFWAIAEMPVEG